MKKFQLNKKTYEVPTKWSEVTLKMQMKVSEDASKIIDNEVLQRISLISGYCNIPIEELKKTNINRVAELFKHLKFINEPLPTGSSESFEWKGEKYHVMPSLLEGQFQDWVNIETAFSNHKDDPYNALPIVIAVLAKKEGETLYDFDLVKRAKEFEELPMTVIEPIRVFFSAIGVMSSLSSQLYSKESQQEIVRNKLIELKGSLNRQVGGGLLTKSLRGLMKLWVKYLEVDVTKYFNSIQ